MSLFAIPLSPRQGVLKQGIGLRVLDVLSATLIVAFAAHISFRIPFTPVPFTMQPLAVLAAGLLLGPLDGAIAMLVYLAEGAAGLPVFSPTGPGGLLQLFGPTGGYLMADPVVAFTAGKLALILTNKFGKYWAGVVGGTIATALLFLSGTAWLSHLHLATGGALWMAAVIPFLPGEIVKIFIAAGLYQTFHSKILR